MFILNANKSEELTAYLYQKNWLAPEEEVIEISVPGDGNMNCVLRIRTSNRSFIIKQSRDYVEKYPQIAAPEKRVLTEGAFYSKIAKVKEIQSVMPSILGIDAENNLIALEDLGPSNDYTILYDLEQKMTDLELEQLVHYLNNLHHSFEKTVVDEELMNTEMRRLNYEHIFEYPFRIDNGFDLDTVQKGLQDLAIPYKKDTILKRKVEQLGTLYLSKGKYLLHGDYYPGSWLNTTKGMKLIDPEFCFYGLREFDLGVFLAHLYITQQGEAAISFVKENYSHLDQLNKNILDGFIGTEIIRRLIGLAQLPLKMDLQTKSGLLVFARDLILKQ